MRFVVLLRCPSAILVVCLLVSSVGVGAVKRNYCSQTHLSERGKDYAGRAFALLEKFKPILSTCAGAAHAKVSELAKEYNVDAEKGTFMGTVLKGQSNSKGVVGANKIRKISTWNKNPQSIWVDCFLEALHAAATPATTTSTTSTSSATLPLSVEKCGLHVLELLRRLSMYVSGNLHERLIFGAAHVLPWVRVMSKKPFTIDSARCFEVYQQEDLAEGKEGVYVWTDDMQDRKCLTVPDSIVPKVTQTGTVEKKHVPMVEVKQTLQFSSRAPQVLSEDLPINTSLNEACRQGVSGGKIPVAPYDPKGSFVLVDPRGRSRLLSYEDLFNAVKNPKSITFLCRSGRALRANFVVTRRQ